jgi:hypothetical protein
MAQARRKSAAPPVKASHQVDGDAIAKLAYELWVGRGRPIGSPEQDWYEAERILKAEADAASRQKTSMAAG